MIGHVLGHWALLLLAWVLVAVALAVPVGVRLGRDANRLDESPEEDR